MDRDSRRNEEWNEKIQKKKEINAREKEDIDNEWHLQTYNNNKRRKHINVSLERGRDREGDRDGDGHRSGAFRDCSDEELARMLAVAKARRMELGDITKYDYDD